MSLWRRTAIEKFPRLHRVIADADSAAWAWFEIRHALQDAYRQSPLDEAFVADVYNYAHWCLHHQSSDIRTAVIFWFYEDLATDDLLGRDIARWISQEDFTQLESTWRYVLSDENMRALQRGFAAHQAQRQGIASRQQRNLIKRATKAKQSAE